MSKCPECGQQTLNKQPAGPGQGDWWICTNAQCKQYNKPRNLDPDDED